MEKRLEHTKFILSVYLRDDIFGTIALKNYIKENSYFVDLFVNGLKLVQDLFCAMILDYDIDNKTMFSGNALYE